MKHPRLFLFGCASVLSAFAACSAGGGSSTTGGGGGDGGSGQGGAGTATSTSATESVGALNPTTTSTTSGNTNCPSTSGQDNDGDGYAVPEDCNDCDENVNPGSVEVPTGDGPPADEDCDGEVDNIAECDEGLALNDTKAESAAKAIGICSGLVEAKYVRANGSAVSDPKKAAGLLTKFGSVVKPRAGSTMLALSTGTARDASQPDGCGSTSCPTTGSGKAPTGFPQDAEGCEQAKNIADDVGLEVKLKAPKNATGLAYSFSFFSFEYPEYVCSPYNDQFIALMSPAPADAKSGNISFDNKGNPVSINIAFFDVCKGCALGDAELQGTGFDTWDDLDSEEAQLACLFTTGKQSCTCEELGAKKGCDEAGGTSWLETEAPVTGGEEVTLRFAIWDTGDQALDSTVLVDGFKWLAKAGVSTGTKPIPK